MIAIIAAVTPEKVIGKNNELPWRIPEDLKNFKKITSGNAILMGRKTFDSIGRPLPNRNNIIISKSMQKKHMQKTPCIDICRSIQEGLEKARSYGRDVFVIGGATIYKQTMDIADKLYLSWVKEKFKGDTYFPDFNMNEWEVEEKQDYPDFEFIIYKRKQKE